MGYYDSISEGYLALHSEEQLCKAHIILSEIKPQKTDLLLDVGCGPAPYFRLIHCSRVGIDPSMALLKQARGGLFIQAFAEQLPFKDRSFDYIISITAVHNFSSIAKGLGEIRRVAKGTVVLSILRASRKHALIDRQIRRNFQVKKVISEDKDDIYFCLARKDCKKR